MPKDGKELLVTFLYVMNQLDVVAENVSLLKSAIALKDGLENTAKLLSALLLAKMVEFAMDLTPAIALKFLTAVTIAKSQSALLSAKMAVFASLLMYVTALDLLDGMELVVLMVFALLLVFMEDALLLTSATVPDLAMPALCAK